MTEHIVIIGGGLTAARAADSARADGFTGRMTIFTDEDRTPYERPPLSKGYLLGTEDAASTIPLPATWYADNDIAVRTATPVEAIDPVGHTVTSEGGETRYDRLLIATGARPRRFTGPGAGLRGVYGLRTLHDSTVLRTALAVGGRRVAIIGAGWIGLEVAAAARGYGNAVTVIGLGDIPLEAAIGPELGEVFAELHRSNGVELRMNASVAAVVGDRRVSGVVLSTGERLDADIVVVGIGAIPNTELAARAGITVDNGIVTDAGFATSAADVYAAGDVASAFHPVLGHQLRIEHWANARNQGASVGRALAGAMVRYDEIPYFFTDQYDLGMEYSGYGELAAGASVVVRGDRAAREFIAFWVQNSHVVAGMNVNVWEVNDAVQALIRSDRPVDPARLADPSVPFESLIEA